MTELVLIHRHRNGNPLTGILNSLQSRENSLAALWSTCLREIIFLSSGDFLQIQDQVLEGDEVYQGAEVFTFLIEVVCGLKSPMLGETEVQGQFKQFVADLVEGNSNFWGFYSGFFQSVLSESKRVRTAHLKNLGSQSYGSLIRRRLGEESEVAILGAGQLTQEILPWMKHLKLIDIYARTPQKIGKFKAGFPQVKAHSWPATPKNSVVVIAAPISNENLMLHLLKSGVGSGLTKLLDLRGEFSLDAEQLAKLGLESNQYESLKELMSEMNLDLARIQTRVGEARLAIRKCGEAFGNRMTSRPGGWEDLCG